ncbi:putative 6-hexanolactone hydrolase, partial [Aureobasidium melanogenum]
MVVKGKLGLRDYGSLLNAFAKILFVVPPATVFRRLAFRKTTPKSLKAHVGFSVGRTLIRNASIPIMQALSGSSEDVFEKWKIKNPSNKVETVTLQNGKTKAFWIGGKHADTTMLYFHGGGYAASASPGHYDLVAEAESRAANNNASFSTLFLQYDLIPSACYPAQLQQAVQALDYLTNTMQRPLGKIILAGDSAGANLALALLSHISEPHPEVDRITPTGNFKKVVLLSPWVTFDGTAAAFKENAWKDVLDSRALHQWSQAFLGGAKPDSYNTPLLAPPDWWSGIRADKICIAAGQDEVFVNDILEFSKKLKTQASDVETIICPDEPHDSILLSYIGMPYEKMKDVFFSWILDNANKKSTPTS